MTIYILSLGHRHIKPCPNPDVKNRLCVGFYFPALSWWHWLE
ncbi:hypothetical protein ECDEC10B_6104 [Escherichia coli DEC10B]|nr:hypothetical protein ECSTEC94C_4203 [Escherichia coli STEC_94C]EHV75413.1 hypothetical protein ECDEC7A_4032 [Escherichia coli DEC7A]EHW81142.1 hypothetical protein ECDEC10B_6104 [Escherichia coli DEC10B]